ncbi:MAG: CBS domain-containing protein [Rhodocyclaceae bacterium]|nr:CBS domain-containing protein [Rhodocyclaceae bacterium]
MPNRPISEIIRQQSLTAATPNDTVRTAATLMRDSKVGALLVVDDGRLVGIFTERDALYRIIAEGRDPDATRLADVMTADPQTIDVGKPFRNALHMMFENGYRHVPVLDGTRPVGMVSARDALGLDMLEFESDLELRENITEILG